MTTNENHFRHKYSSTQISSNLNSFNLKIAFSRYEYDASSKVRFCSFWLSLQMKDNKMWKVNSQHLDADPGKRDKKCDQCQTEVQECDECEMNLKSWSAADWSHPKI